MLIKLFGKKKLKSKLKTISDGYPKLEKKHKSTSAGVEVQRD